MLLNLFHEFMHNRNTGQFYAMNSGLQVNRLSGIRMMITADIYLEDGLTGRAVQRNCFTGIFWCHFKNELSKRLLDYLYVS